MRFLLEGLGVLFKTVQLTNQKLSLSTFSLFTTTNIGQWSHQILPVAISYGYHPCPPPSSLLPPLSSIIFLPSLLYMSQNLVTKCVLQDPSYSWMIGPYQHISLDRTKLIGIHTLDNIVMQMSCLSIARFLFRFLKEKWNTAGEFSTLLSCCCSFCLLKIGNVERKLGPFVASGAFQEMEKQ